MARPGQGLEQRERELRASFPELSMAFQDWSIPALEK